MDATLRLEAAERFVADNRFREADMVLADLLAASPRHGPAHRLLAKVRLELADAEGALAAAERAMLLMPGDARTIAELGRVRHHLGDFEAAKLLFEQAVEIDPALTEARIAYAEALAFSGEDEAALVELKTALESGGASCDALVVLANTLHRLGETAGAEGVLRSAVQAAPHHGPALHNLATLLAQKGRAEEALPFAERAHLARPADPLVLAGFADRLMEVGRLPDALKYAARALSLSSATLVTVDSYAKAAILSGKIDDGLQKLATLVKRTPSDLDAAATLALRLRMAGRIEQALQVATRVLAAAPEHGVASVVRSDCLLTKGAFDVLEAASAGADATSGRDAGAPFTILADPALTTLDTLFRLRFVAEAVGGGRAAALAVPAWLASLTGEVFASAPVAVMGREAMADPVVPLSRLGPSAGHIDRAARPVRPYLRAPAERGPVWAEALDAFPGPRIGIAWGYEGTGARLAELLAVRPEGPHTLVSLMWDQHRHDLAGRDDIVDAGINVRDLGDAAAAVAALDLVVGTDGVPIHLAGALGRPAVVILTPAASWHWHEADEDGCSAWYPSVQVIRRPFGAPFESIAPTVRAAIAACLASEREALAPVSADVGD